MSTPEGKVKDAVKRALKSCPPLYQFWPVQMGLGATTLDCLICHRGDFWAIETKRPGALMTPRQLIIRDQIKAAGGHVLLIDSVEQARQLEYALHSFKRE